MSYLPTGAYEEALGASWIDTIGSGLKTAGSWALKTYGEGQKQAGAAQAAQELAKAQALALAQRQQPATTGTDFKKYLPYIAIGGGGLVLLLVLMKRK